MSELKRYQVQSACAVVPVINTDGEITRTLYRGATFEANPGNVRIAHNAASGYITVVGAEAAAGVDASGTPIVDDKPTTGDGNPGDVVLQNDPGTVNEDAHRAVAVARDEAEVRRAAARDKLATLKGSAPDGRAAEDVWVEYAVSKGLDRAEAEKAGKDELRKTLAAK